MSKPMVNGRAPLSSKKKPGGKLGSFGRNLLDIPEHIAAELKEKGLEGRWVSYKQYIDNYGHKNGWTVHKSDIKSTDVLLGQNPDGIIRRGDLVLAVRPKEVCDEHREILAERAARSTGFNKAKANELRQMVKESSLDAKVFEGYEENGE